MSSDQLAGQLVGSFDCKQGAVRAVRFNGEHMSFIPVYTTLESFAVY